MSSKAVDANKNGKKVVENLLSSETRTPSASRLATCEFHLWISYSTDNKHNKCVPSSFFGLRGLMSRIGVYTIIHIAFSACSI